jgi:hypothetical protein
MKLINHPNVVRLYEVYLHFSICVSIFLWLALELFLCEANVLKLTFKEMIDTVPGFGEQD